MFSNHVAWKHSEKEGVAKIRTLGEGLRISSEGVEDTGGGAQSKEEYRVRVWGSE